MNSRPLGKYIVLLYIFLFLVGGFGIIIISEAWDVTIKVYQSNNHANFIFMLSFVAMGIYLLLYSIFYFLDHLNVHLHYSSYFTKNDRILIHINFVISLACCFIFILLNRFVTDIHGQPTDIFRTIVSLFSISFVLYIVYTVFKFFSFMFNLKSKNDVLNELSKTFNLNNSQKNKLSHQIHKNFKKYTKSIIYLSDIDECDDYFISRDDFEKIKSIVSIAQILK